MKKNVLVAITPHCRDCQLCSQRFAFFKAIFSTNLT